MKIRRRPPITFCPHGIPTNADDPAVRCHVCEHEARRDLRREVDGLRQRLAEVEPLADELLRIQALAWVSFAPRFPTKPAAILEARARLNAYLRDLASRCVPTGKPPEPEPVSPARDTEPDDGPDDCPF